MDLLFVLPQEQTRENGKEQVGSSEEEEVKDMKESTNNFVGIRVGLLNI
jgi:hypothetical protein